MANKQSMTPEHRSRVIASMYKHTLTQPSEYLKFSINEQKIDEWYVMIEGLMGADNEFQRGQYLVHIKLPEEFPFKPPQFFFLTPNGVYEIGVKVCVSIGEYHSQNYPSAQKVLGFVTNLVSGIIGWADLGSGINLIKTDIAAKRAMARRSVQYNQEKYPELVEQINKNFDAYSPLWKKPESTPGASASVSTTTTGASASVSTTTTGASASVSTNSDAPESVPDVPLPGVSDDAPASDTSAEVPVDGLSTDTSATPGAGVRVGRPARPVRRKIGEI